MTNLDFYICVILLSSVFALSPFISYFLDKIVTEIKGE